MVISLVGKERGWMCTSEINEIAYLVGIGLVRMPGNITLEPGGAEKGARTGANPIIGEDRLGAS